MKTLENFRIRAEGLMHCYSTPALTQTDRIAQELAQAYNEGVNDQNLNSFFPSNNGLPTAESILDDELGIVGKYGRQELTAALNKAFSLHQYHGEIKERKRLIEYLDSIDCHSCSQRDFTDKIVQHLEFLTSKDERR